MAEYTLVADKTAAAPMSAGEKEDRYREIALQLESVLDVDSSIRAAFDEVDQEWLERIVAMLRTRRPLPVAAVR